MTLHLWKWRSWPRTVSYTHLDVYKRQIRSVADTVLALVRKAHAAGASVIAPEVDNINRAHLLLRLGVDYALGPAFSQPLKPPDFDFTRPLW